MQVVPGELELASKANHNDIDNHNDNQYGDHNDNHNVDDNDNQMSPICKDKQKDKDDGIDNHNDYDKDHNHNDNGNNKPSSNGDQMSVVGRGWDRDTPSAPELVRCKYVNGK